MGCRSLEQRLPYECFTEKKLYILLGPVSSWESLKEHHGFLEVHFAEFVGPFDQECYADVEVKFRETFFFGL
jgi:hypothetical protein